MAMALVVVVSCDKNDNSDSNGSQYDNSKKGGSTVVLVII